MKCTQCGAAIARDDIARGSCSFCQTAFTTASEQPQGLGPARTADEERVYQALLAEYRDTHATVGGVLWRVVLVTAVVGSLWVGIVCGALDGDPWLGAHAAIFCPRVCASCHGPYVYFSWTTSTQSPSGNRRDTTVKVYCRNAVVPIERMSWMERMNAREANAPYELGGGMWTLWGGSLLLWFLLGLPLSIWWAVAVARYDRRNGERLAEQIVRARRHRR